LNKTEILETLNKFGELREAKKKKRNAIMEFIAGARSRNRPISDASLNAGARMQFDDPAPPTRLGEFVADDPVRAAKIGAVALPAGVGDVLGVAAEGINATGGALQDAFGIPEEFQARLDHGGGDALREKAGIDSDDLQAQALESIVPVGTAAKGLSLAGKTILGAAPALAATTKKVTKVGENFDPRFDPRVREQERLKNLEVGVVSRGSASGPETKLADLEGQPFVTSMSDRTAAGDTLVDINGVPLSTKVDRRGGQGFIFENPGQVWASAKSPVSNIMNVAKKVKAETGVDPLFIPWRMAPTGGDFSTMTGETMISFASANMGKGVKRSLNARLKKFIPGWKGVDDPESFGQYRATPDPVRKAIKDMMDTQFRDKGGLSIGEARLAVTDPAQFNARESGIQNVGRIFPDKEISQSSHPSYPFAVPGEGVGTIKEEVGILELLPKVARRRDVPNPAQPRAIDNRAMQMGAKSGIITEDILQKLQDRGVNVNALPLAVIISSAAAYGLLAEQDMATEGTL
jgi:hypothetical protein